MKRVLRDIGSVSDIHLQDTEFYFRYRGMAMSVLHGPHRTSEYGPFSFYLYPKSVGIPLSAIAHEANNRGMKEPEMFSFNSADFRGEDQRVFEELYAALRRKHLNIDGVFDQLLS
ncbi:MAG: hypothetical protein KF715_18115 [Candidatus Didemnitutus sp.]|nr:hypothetical protein [Candidatus Didemnitutus sp.]